jgi:hypothetical protein
MAVRKWARSARAWRLLRKARFSVLRSLVGDEQEDNGYNPFMLCVPHVAVPFLFSSSFLLTVQWRYLVVSAK